LKGYGTCSI